VQLARTSNPTQQYLQTMTDSTPAEALRNSLARALVDSHVSEQAPLVKRIKKVLHAKASRTPSSDLEKVVLGVGVELQQTGFLFAASQACFSFLVDRAPSNRKSPKTATNQIVEAHYHPAKCDIREALDLDPFLKDTSTFKAICHSFDLVCRGLELVLRRSESERHDNYWLIQNGTILIVELAEPMLEQGFQDPTIKPLCLAVLASESTILLRPASFLAWRTRLYILLARAVSLQGVKEPTKALKAGLQVLNKLDEQIQLLEDIETEEPPLVLDTIREISNARTESWKARQVYELLLGNTTCREQSDAVDTVSKGPQQEVDDEAKSSDLEDAPASDSMNEQKADVVNSVSNNTGKWFYS
jgi:hypothetical protein